MNYTATYHQGVTLVSIFRMSHIDRCYIQSMDLGAIWPDVSLGV